MFSSHSRARFVLLIAFLAGFPGLVPDARCQWLPGFTNGGSASTSTQTPTSVMPPTALPPNMPPDPAYIAPHAAVTVNAANYVRTVDERMFGLNTAVWDSALSSASTLSALQQLQIRTLRFPGGSTSDTYDWKTNRSYAAGTRTLNNWAWASSFDAFAAIALKLKAQVFLTANYGSGTAQQAADWVKYANVTKRYGFKYWEIGNENYGSWEEDLHAKKWDPVTYATQVKDYLARMKKADPTIKVGVVVVTGEDAYADAGRTAVKNPRTKVAHRGWTPVMLAKLKSLGVTPDFAIYHRYEQNPKDAWNAGESDAALLQSAKTWGKDAADLRQQLIDYLGATAAAKVELVVTENNSVSYDPGKQTTNLVNGLFLADSLGRVLQTEFNAFVWWDLHNGKDTTNNNSSALYGWRNYGDCGVLSPTDGRYPTFYVMKLLARFARGGDRVVKVSNAEAMLGAYAVRRADGTLTLLLINKSPTEARNADVTVKYFTPKSTAAVLRYGIAQDQAARTSSTSAASDLAASTLTGIGSTFTVLCDPYSVMLVTLSPAK